MRRLFLFPVFLALAIWVSALSYHIADTALSQWKSLDDLRFISGFTQKFFPSQGQQTHQKRPTISENKPAQPVINPSQNKQAYIDNIFSKLGSFEKTSGQWQVRGSKVIAQGDIIYRSDEHQMSLRLTDASFDWDANNPEVMYNPSLGNIEVTTAWPMADPLFAEEDSLWQITGMLDIKQGQLILVHALNENYEILRTSFTPIQLNINGQKTGRILDNILTAFYNLSVALMLEVDINGTQKLAELMLSYMVGMPVKIGNLEGDLSAGKLIFENIILGEEGQPLVQFSQGKIEYNLDKSQAKRTKMHITDFSLYDPITFVQFTPQEGENILLSQNLIPIGDRLLSQGEDMRRYVDRLYIPITYEKMNIGEGFIELKQNEQSMRSQVSAIQIGAAELDRVNQYTSSQTYGLMAVYFARLSETAATIYADQTAASGGNNRPSGPEISGDLQGLMNSTFIPPLPSDLQIQPGGNVNIGNPASSQPSSQEPENSMGDDLIIPDLTLDF